MSTPSTSFSLPQFSVFVLTGALEQPGWAVTSRDHGCAFQLLETVLPAVKLPEELRSCSTQRAARDAAPSWCSQMLAVDITERQRDTVKKCLSTLRDKGALPPGWGTFALLSAFGLADE